MTEQEKIEKIATRIHDQVQALKVCRTAATASHNLLGTDMALLPQELREVGRELEKLAVEIIQSQLNFTEK